jgi:membrane-bound inhibitor of C-type lysozyme
MATLIRKTLLACSLALAAGALCAAPAPNSSSKTKPKSKLPAAAVLMDEPEPDLSDKLTTEYDCELGNKVTVFHNDADSSHIALRWKKRTHRLTRVTTTTGAKRFENVNHGLIWIGIPAKGMLLDSKLNRQLANECKNAEQAAPPPEKAAPKFIEGVEILPESIIPAH